MKYLSFIFIAFMIYINQPSASELWTHYAISDTINCIIGHGDYIWMGTQNGIVRMNRKDGSQTWFIAENSNLAEKYVNYIVSDKDGKIFAGSKDTSKYHYYSTGGISFYNGESWKVYKKDTDGLCGNDIAGLAVDDNNTVWVALNDRYGVGTGDSVYVTARQVIQYYENSSWQIKKTVSFTYHSTGGDWTYIPDDILAFDAADSGYFVYGHKADQGYFASLTGDIFESGVYIIDSDKTEHHTEWINNVIIEKKENNKKIIWVNGYFTDLIRRMVYVESDSISGRKIWNILTPPIIGFNHTFGPIIIDKNNT